MKRLVLVLALLGSSACGGFFGGSCPDTDELTRLEVLSGEYTDAEVFDDGGLEAFAGATNTRLVIDREAGTATLAFTNADGQQVEIDYLATSAEFEF